ncbi:MAG: alpha/beta hydrolase [Chloroflexales bacterium]|nr:alpha/beta hydrolase [Chloroflexales bacterium]
MMNGVAAHDIRFGDSVIRYYTAGDHGPPVVLLHGGGSDAAMLTWKKIIGPLAESYRVYAPNLPGHGDSPPYRGRFTQEALVHCVGEILDAWGLERAALVGLSMGGSVAIGYTLTHPDRVTHLIPIDSGGLQARAPFHRIAFFVMRMPLLNELMWGWMRNNRNLVRMGMRNIIYTPSAITDELVDDVYAVLQTARPEHSFHQWQIDETRWRGLRTNYMPRLHTITCPVLIIHGDKDAIVPLACAQEAAARIPNAQLHIIKDCGHWPTRERSEVVAQAICSFLTRMEQAHAPGV